MRAFLLFLTLLPWPLGAQELKVLAPNETIFVDVEPGVPIEVSRSDILSVQDFEDQIKVRAKKRGTSTIRAGNKRYRFEVVSTASAQNYRRLDRRAYKGLQLTPGKEGVVVSGKLLRVSDYESLLETMSPGWSFQARVPEDLQKEFTSTLHKILRELGQSELLIKFSPSPQVLLPRGSFSQLQPTLRRLGLAHTMSSTALRPRASLPVTFVLAEISKQALKDLGVRSPESTSLQVLPKVTSPEEVMVQLDHFAGQGLARRLAQPRLHLSSGKLAKYHSGGEVPIRSSGFASSQVEWKAYGFLLEVQAHFNSEDQLDLDLKLELSSLDAASGGDGTPGVLKKQYENQIFMDQKTPVVLVDFLDLQTMEQASGLPFLSSLPLLGFLFASQTTLHQDSRFCLLILPNF